MNLKLPLIALALGLGALTATTMVSSPVEARTAERATMNRLDPARITSKRVQRNDYAGSRRMHRNNFAGNRYRWSTGEDRRYRRYSGWNRYYSRPSGWRNRGCVSLGPIWFCP